MKPDYKNWIPKGMLFSLIAGTMLSLALLLVFGVFGIGVNGKLRAVLGVVFGIAFVVCARYTQWCVYAYRSFSYDGKRKLSKQIIEGTASHITLPEGGVGLDVGCGSGALTIACAKRNPQGKMVGIDRWGKEYASFSLPLQEDKTLLDRNIRGIGIALCLLTLFIFLSGCGSLKDDTLLIVNVVITEVDTGKQTITVKDDVDESTLGEECLIDCSSIPMAYCDFATQKVTRISFEDLQVNDKVIVSIRSSEIEKFRSDSGGENTIKVEQLQLYTQRAAATLS